MSDQSLAPAAIHGGAVFETYRQEVASGRLQPDPAQKDAALALDRLACALVARQDQKPGLLARFSRRAPEPMRGIYLVGEVGRGKTMLMDLFCRESGVRKKRRIHFHVFLQEVLRVLNREQRREARQEDPMRELAQKIHQQNDLLCFDEFQINDMSEALLVLRLLDMVMALGTVVVATSNTAPVDLMKNQPQNRATMKPFLATFAGHMHVITLEAVRDYRRGRALDDQRWLVPDSEEQRVHLRQVFEELTGGEAGAGSLAIGSRRIAIPACHGAVAWFDFDSLCGVPLGPADYLALAGRFQTLFIVGIPVLVPSEFDKARRFITLIDVFYESSTALFATANSLPETLYRDGDNAKAFERTVSRLEEMRSSGWGVG